MASSPFVQTLPFSPPQASVRSYQRPVGTSFLVHGGFAAGAWAIGALTDRVDVKDQAWFAAPVANAWYQAVGIPVLRYGLPVGVALRGLSWRQALLLAGVTTWGVRGFTGITSRVVSRSYDDVRYNKDKQTTSSFWPKAALYQFLPEALFQTLIALPFTAPFRSTRVALQPWGWTDLAAVALFTVGQTLEALADYQKAAAKKRGLKGLYREGVWSIVRHPNYLGDALTHLSFALLAVNTPSYNPALFLGPITNYLFLRFVGGDAQTEASQDERYNEFDPHKEAQLATYRKSKNAFWPALGEFANTWTWTVLGAGVLGVALEKGVRTLVDPGLL